MQCSLLYWLWYSNIIQFPLFTKPWWREQFLKLYTSKVSKIVINKIALIYIYNYLIKQNSRYLKAKVLKICLIFRNIWIVKFFLLEIDCILHNGFWIQHFLQMIFNYPEFLICNEICTSCHSSLTLMTCQITKASQ